MTIITSPVRKAVPADRPELLQMCRDGFDEHGQFTMSEARVDEMMDLAFGRGGAIIGVVGDTGALQASIYLRIDRQWYTDEWSISELWNYVIPDYRKSTHAKEMIAFGKRCSDEIGIPLTIGVVSNDRTRAKMELYRRQLGEPVGGYFMHRPARPLAIPAV